MGFLIDLKVPLWPTAAAWVTTALEFSNLIRLIKPVMVCKCWPNVIVLSIPYFRKESDFNEFA